MNTYWRIQPRGKSIEHVSTTSSGELGDGLHVLEEAWQTMFLDVGQNLRMVRRAYGDEIVEIEAPRSWDNRDVEGVEVDPREARVVGRYTWAQWLSYLLGRTITRATEAAYSEARQVLIDRNGVPK